MSRFRNNLCVNLAVALLIASTHAQAQYFDSETGLHYNGARYYEPKTGRYLSSDPISVATHVQSWKARLGKPGQGPLELNPYLYVNANPLRYVDPSGLATSLCPEGVVIGGGACSIYDQSKPDTIHDQIQKQRPKRCATAACAADLPNYYPPDNRSALLAEQETCKIVCGTLWLGPMIPLARSELLPWIGGQVSGYFGCKWVCRPENLYYGQSCPTEP